MALLVTLRSNRADPVPRFDRCLDKIIRKGKYMLSRIWRGVREIPWWAWLIQGVGAIVVAIISYFIGSIAA